MSSSPSSSTSHGAWITSFFVLALAAAGCAPQQTCPAVTTAASPHPPPHDRAVYRFDFGLTTNDGTGAPPTTSSFTLNLQEHDKGEVHVGKNVALSSAPPAAASGTTGGAGGPRQDVGLKVAAEFHIVGDEPLLATSLEMSAFDPPSTIRKVVARGDALAVSGKPVLVTSLEEDHKRYQLTVTATKVR
jgi:hypothetical protein